MNKSHCIVYGDLAANCIFGKESRKTFERASKLGREASSISISQVGAQACSIMVERVQAVSLCLTAFPAGLESHLPKVGPDCGQWGMYARLLDPWMPLFFFVQYLFQDSLSLLGFIQEAWVLRYTIARVLQRNTRCSIERNQENWLVWLSLTNWGNFRRLTTCKWGGK